MIIPKASGQMEESEIVKQPNDIDLSFMALYKKAIKDWPDWIYNTQAYDIVDEMHAKYYHQDIELLMCSLHSSFSCFIPSSSKGKIKFFMKDLNPLSVKVEFEYGLQDQINHNDYSYKSAWSPSQIALAQVYLDNNRIFLENGDEPIRARLQQEEDKEKQELKR